MTILAETETTRQSGRTGRWSRRVGHFLTAPDRLIALIMAIILCLLVIVPLFQLIRETVTVQPYDAVYLPGRAVGELTSFHYERVFTGRMSWALFYKPFMNSLVTAFGATAICLALGALLA